MRNKLIILLIIFNLIIFCDYLFAKLKWPIDHPKRITGTFAEYRGARFHQGLDISCSAKKGVKIFAADNGYISTVKYQKFGIGYAIILKHNNGFKSLYGHLDRFSRVILRNKKVRQFSKHILDKKDFQIDFHGPEIKINRGAVIGYSGDSGIGIEHLHFELHDKNDNPVNPLKYGINVYDKSAPIIKELFLVPLNGSSHIDGFSSEIVYDTKLVNKKKRIYTIDADTMPVIAGEIGIKIMVYDHVGYWNKVAIYGIETYINNKKSYKKIFKKIMKKNNKQMGLYYDYDNSNYNYFTYFLHSRINKKGIINTKNNTGKIRLKVICFDANNNRSTLSVILKAGKTLNPPEYDYKPNLFPGRTLKLKSENKKFKIKFNAKSAKYEDMVFLESGFPMYIYISGLKVKSRTYSLTPTNLYIEKPARITFKYNGSDFKKVGIYTMTGPKNIFYFLSNNYNEDNNTFSADVRKLGKYFLVKDESPPGIKFKNNKRRRKKRGIKLNISEIGTGINLGKVYLKVDGKDVIWDYDPDKRHIEILPHNRIWKKGKHTISIRLQDRAGNRSKKKIYYYYIQ